MYSAPASRLESDTSSVPFVTALQDEEASAPTPATTLESRHHQASFQLLSDRFAVVESTSFASRLLTPGVPVTASDHSPVLALFLDRTRTVYCVPFVRIGIVCDAPVVTLACRVADHSSAPDFHWTS